MRFAHGFVTGSSRAQSGWFAKTCAFFLLLSFFSCKYDEVLDYEGIKQRGTLRILAPRISEQQFLPRSGYPIDYGRTLAARFAERVGLEPEFVWVNSRDDLIPSLLRGSGDLIAANMTVTEDRSRVVLFSDPVDVVREQLVTRIDDGQLAEPSDLEGRTIALRESSSYWRTAQELQQQFPGMEIRLVSERLDTEEILYRVATGRYDLTIADDNIVNQALGYLSDLRHAFDVSEQKQVAWGLRPGADDLKAALDSFLVDESLRPLRAVRQFGDLDAIVERGVLRVLTTNSAATYFVWRGELLGFEYELARRLARDLGVRLEIVVPPNRGSLRSWLLQGYGDLIAAGLTRPETGSEAAISFSRRYNRAIETLVARADEPPVIDLPALADRTIAVRRRSSYWDTAQELVDSGIEVDIVAVPEVMETEEIIAAVAAGDYDLTIADSHVLDIELSWRDDIRGVTTFGDSVSHSWGVRAEDGELLAAVNSFFRSEYRGRWYNITRNKYFGPAQLARERQLDRDSARDVVSPFDELFREYGDRFGFDWRLLAAQAYEESRFDPRARSRVGAMGLMQIMPQTARGFGFDDPDDPSQAIHLGALYLRHQADQFGPELKNNQDRIWFALASYNAGFGHVGDARRLAVLHGKDPDRWFGEVEEIMPLLARSEFHSQTRYGYCRCSEPVNYVRRIREKFRAYRQLFPNEI